MAKPCKDLQISYILAKAVTCILTDLKSAVSVDVYTMILKFCHASTLQSDRLCVNILNDFVVPVFLFLDDLYNPKNLLHVLMGRTSDFSVDLSNIH